MKKIIYLALAVISLTTLSCKDNNNAEEKLKKLEAKLEAQSETIKEQKEERIREKELALLEKERELESKEINLQKNIAAQSKINEIKEEYIKRIIVISERAYFHSSPNSSTRKKQYIINGDYAQTERRSNGYLFIKYVNYKNQVTKGWVDENDVSYY
ncbi:hypothetical protein N8328_04405 [Crocinitomicaceae bacterium]|nr:hypothetical protein [Crocinitomicaceae bacterium]